MSGLGLIFFLGWAALIYLCVNPEAGVRFGAWLRNDKKK